MNIIIEIKVFLLCEITLAVEDKPKKKHKGKPVNVKEVKQYFWKARQNIDQLLKLKILSHLGMINRRNHSVRKNKGDNNNVLQCNDLTYLVLWKFIENQDPKKSSESIWRSTVKGKKKDKETTYNQV